jgi:hypothetical protein
MVTHIRGISIRYTEVTAFIKNTTKGHWQQSKPMPFHIVVFARTVSYYIEQEKDQLFPASISLIQLAIDSF